MWLWCRNIFACLCILFVMLSLLACGGASSPACKVDGDTLPMRYSSLLTMVECDSFTIADVKNPWRDGVVQRYVLLPRDVAVPSNLPKGILLRTPLENMLLFSSVHVNLFATLGCLDAVHGVCDAKYMLLQGVHDRIATGDIVDCGSSQNIDGERVCALSPDAIFVLPFENGGYGKLERIGSPLVACTEYMETSPLAAAEWMRFYGRLVGCGSMADSLFAVVCGRYEELATMVSAVERRPSLMCELKGGSAGYRPAGESTMGQLYQAAGADYLFSYNKGSGSVPLAYETVLDKAANADVWLFKYNSNKDKTLSALAGDFAGYRNFKPFKEGRVYACNSAVRPFYEETPFRPDLLLNELMAIFYPTLFPGYKLRYYEKLEE